MTSNQLFNYSIFFMPDIGNLFLLCSFYQSSYRFIICIDLLNQDLVSLNFSVFSPFSISFISDLCYPSLLTYGLI
jgi:hypothetical protein